jgi:hypothetical protein
MNHTDDCPDCGTDQRSSAPGLFCCAPAREKHERQVAEFRAVQVERRQLLERLGIRASTTSSRIYTGEWDTVPDLPTLFAFLHSLPTPGL